MEDVPSTRTSPVTGSATSATGEAPTPELAGVFAKISAWMKEVWAQTKQRKLADSPDEVSEVFDRMLAPMPEGGDELASLRLLPSPRPARDRSQEYRGGVRPAAAGQTIGVPRLSREAIERGKNELVLYQGGRLSPDPAALVDVYLKRLRFQETLDARDELWAIGRPMTREAPEGGVAGPQPGRVAGADHPGGGGCTQGAGAAPPDRERS